MPATWSGATRKLGVHEDFFVNYGFVTSELQALMHPRVRAPLTAQGGPSWTSGRRTRAQQLLEFVREKGVVHPDEVDRHFAHGRVTNYWGGASNATTHLLGALHYQGWLRVVRREAGIRLYSVHEHGGGPIDKVERDARLDALVDAAVHVYAPCRWETENSGAAGALCGAAVGAVSDGSAATGGGAAVARKGGWDGMVLAGRRESEGGGAAGDGAIARAV